MRLWAVLALRVVLALLLGGSVFVQAVMVPLLAADLGQLAPEHAWLKAPLIAVVVLGVVCCQVILVCVWRLVTMVRRDTVFSPGAFRYVHVVIGALVAAAAVVFALACLLAPGEAVAPGVVLLICGVVLAVLGMALIVLVLRVLLAQAVALDAELKDVI
ncbi:DUF2975 domain-containing protein [Saccharopolyspora griseoalba]|uniref:DUF2975 domain-containing protein n=1 Tax=Saccharopolyspora griseoalba TaxID=1431848 RepID=A0ABW2LP77_9PSEU